MRINASIVVFCASLVLAGARATDPSPPLNARDIAAENDVFEILEKRRGCSGNRLNTDECQGNRGRSFNSFHNW